MDDNQRDGCLVWILRIVLSAAASVLTVYYLKRMGLA